MMECKRALQETGGDFDEAVKLLRERGMRRPRSAPAARPPRRRPRPERRLDRDDRRRRLRDRAGLQERDFEAFARDVLREVHVQGEEAGLAPLEQRRSELSARLGENIQVVGARRMRAEHGERFVSYVHPPARKIGCC